MRWALALKRLPWDSVAVEVGAPSAELAALNPLRAVPTLELGDGRVLTESVAIIEWLEETHPSPPLLPADPWERAHVRELVQLVNSGIHPMQNTIVREAISADPEARRAWAARWIERGLEAFERHLGEGRFSAGDWLTMADLFLIPQIRNADRHGARVPDRLRQIHATCLETPEARETA